MSAFVIAAVFAVYFLFSLYVPYIGDDYLLRVDWMSANGGDRTFSWSGLWRFAAYMRETDNARIDNVIYGGMCLSFPKWVLAVLVGGSAAVMMWAASRLVSPAKRVLPFVLIAFWAWVTFTFSWRGGVMGVDNSFNVLLPSAVTLVFLLTVRGAGSSKMFQSVPALVGGCLYALFAGTIHEGYSVPVCCGLGLWCLIGRWRMPWRWWVLTLSYAAGALYVITAPGIWARFGYSDSLNVAVNVKTQISVMLSVIACVILVPCAGIAALRRSGLKGLGMWFREAPMRAVIAVTFIVSVVVVVKTGFENPRAMWICNLFAAVFMFQVLAPVFVTWPRRVLAGLSGVALVLVVAFYGNVLRVQKAVYDEESLISELMAESEWGSIYRDYDITMPKTTLLHPVKAHWRSVPHITSYDEFMDDGRHYAVVPECLAGLTDEMVDFIEGRADAKALSADQELWPQPVHGSADCFVFRGALLKKDERMECTNWLGKTSVVNADQRVYDYLCDDGRRIDGMPTVLLRFVTPSGRKLIYVAPTHVKVSGPYKKISVAE